MSTFAAPEPPEEPEPEQPELEPEQPEEETETETTESEEAEQEILEPEDRELSPPPKMTALEPLGYRLDQYQTATFELDQRRAKAYAESGYWPDARSLAQALVRIEAGRELGLPALIAMSEIHVIEGKPTLGAGALSMLVKASGRYDYRVQELSNARCELWFYDTRSGELLGESTFTIDDAKQADLLAKKGETWRRYPRNMLFARALSNGVAWYCSDVTGGRFYVPEEMGAVEPVAV
jgi:hypothetical protein